MSLREALNPLVLLGKWLNLCTYVSSRSQFTSSYLEPIIILLLPLSGRHENMNRQFDLSPLFTLHSNMQHYWIRSHFYMFKLAISRCFPPTSPSSLCLSLPNKTQPAHPPGLVSPHSISPKESSASSHSWSAAQMSWRGPKPACNQGLSPPEEGGAALKQFGNQSSETLLIYPTSPNYSVTVKSPDVLISVPQIKSCVTLKHYGGDERRKAWKGNYLTIENTENLFNIILQNITHQVKHKIQIVSNVVIESRLVNTVSGACLQEQSVQMFDSPEPLT